MRFVALFVTLFVTQNVYAQQTDPAAEPAAEPAADQAPPDPGTPPNPRTEAVETCVTTTGGDITACCGNYVDCQGIQAQLGQEARDLIDSWANAYGETPEQSGRRLCRSIGGSWGDQWDGSNWRANCECNSPREWDADHKFCVPPNADYLERLCTESGGRWTGGNCDCQGKHLEGGRCTGQNRIELLEGQLATAQETAHQLGTDLEAANRALTEAHTAGTTQVAELAALERQYNDLERQLNEALQRIAYLQGRLEAEGVSVPTPPPGTTAETAPGTTEPIPGAAEAAAEVAAESTQSQVGETPSGTPTVEEEEGWPEWAKWLLGIGIAGAVTAGTLIPLCESGVICHTSIVQ